MPLGETLVSLKIITAEQLAQALEKQKATPQKRIGEVIVEMGFADAAAIDKALKQA
ncbi:MAG: hypothetical protein AABZ39_15815 [Spirochaetota bacterium]